jgi:hypothetical protein
MLDLTGANLIGYLLRIIRDSVSRNPRFNNTLGQVTFQSNNFLKYGDTQITLRDISASGNRLSPDYFLCNQYGRALVAKVEGKEGTFIEWITETDKTLVTPEAGVYYLNIDAVNEETNDIDITVEKYRWVQGHYTNAVGSLVYLRPGIDGTTLTAKDGATGNAVAIEGSSNYVYLLVPTQTLELYDSNNNPLTPMTDYWYQRLVPEVIIQNTVGGAEVANILPPWVSFTLVDQTGYQLRQGIDWNFFGLNFIQLSSSAPPGSTITANVIRKIDPSTTVGTNPENILQVGVLPTESLAPGQVFIHTTENDYYNAIVNADGTVTLPTLLKPGDWVRWEVRIASGQTTCRGKKFSLNGFYDTYLDKSNVVQFVTDPTTNLRTDTIPGLAIAIGDSVVVGDQAAIIVNPTTTETYDVYGSKENLNFTIDVRTNDLQTSSDLSELIKQQILIYRRENMEADGITIFEAPRSFRSAQRDSSGTAPTYTYSISVSAMADWKVFVPKVTRLVSFIITDTAGLPDFQGKLQMAPRVQALGNTRFQFVQSYS